MEKKDTSSSTRYPKTKGNKLLGEHSPYLLQHAYNPVHWYPWGPDAFKKALRENKPIFLSIGYSTCHWCHVMAHESFEDTQVADLMNKVFVCIKVDREEHPAVDHVYMTVCQMMTGTGGWPLSIIMTPDKKPFFAGTYIPKNTRFGKIGMLELIPQVEKLWEKQQTELVDSADKIMIYLRKTTEETERKMTLDLMKLIKKGYQELAGLFDEKNGGFGSHPKFPMAQHLFFLLRYWAHFKTDFALEMVEKTLTKLQLGGIFDHVGFGFHRYATDTRWQVPHFEKMLYDQALLSMAFLECYQVTKKEIYAQTARNIFTYTLRELRSPQGGFYSAEDADSEGKEGTFYLWGVEDLCDILTENEQKICQKVYNVLPEGNYYEEATGKRNGLNILYQTQTLKENAKDLQISLSELNCHLERIRKKLFRHRNHRIHPAKDDKILTDWNGLMIAALAMGGRILGEQYYIKAAEKAADFILQKMSRSDGRLCHRYRKGDISFVGNLADHVFNIWGCIELYEATFRIKYLRWARNLTDALMTYFWDSKKGGFFTTAHDSEKLLFRPKEIYDGAIPSANSVALLNLLRLAHLTGNYELEKKAGDLIEVFIPSVVRAPSQFCFFLEGINFFLGSSGEIVIAGKPGDPDTRQLIKIIQENFAPNQVLLFRTTTEKNPEITKIAPFTKNHKALNNQTTVYICKNHICQTPLVDKKKIRKALTEQKNDGFKNKNGVKK